MDTHLPIPESVIDYLHDRSVRSVVDHMLSQDGNEVPEDLEWRELRNYNNAWLAARKVKVDYAALIMDLWSATWKPALHKHGISEDSAYSISEMKGENESPSLGKIWSDEGFALWYSVGSTNNPLYLSLTTYLLRNNSQTQLAFYATDEESDLSAPLKLSSNWKPELNQWDNRETIDKLYQIKSAATVIDTTKLIQLADEVIGETLKIAS